MNIALIGYGKMGKIIESIAVSRGHSVNLKIDISNAEMFTVENLQKCDVAIEFTGPHSAFNNVMKSLEANIPIVCGSTGWLSQYDEAVAFCNKQQGTLLYASNFSVGVNVFFEVNKLLAGLMSNLPDYDVSITEIHHTEKKDAPSGTAITLAEQILALVNRKETWENVSTTDKSKLTIISERIDPAPGTHKICYSSAIDDIEIIHTAHNRNGFATGAVLAAEFLLNKKGIFTMKDVLGF
ncbi:MAG: 4-hydroxy-tetrahydrodipicolinate reductase [Chitinophagaceae bacterium]|nr:4-hydroxy-tetrahydrodipicolinate reductase [Chitinophagaceae bacterium]